MLGGSVLSELHEPRSPEQEPRRPRGILPEGPALNGRTDRGANIPGGHAECRPLLGEQGSRCRTSSPVDHTKDTVLRVHLTAHASPAGDECTSPQLDGFLETTAPDRCKRWLGADPRRGAYRAAEPAPGPWAAARKFGRRGALNGQPASEETSPEAIRKPGRLMERCDSELQEPSVPPSTTSIWECT